MRHFCALLVLIYVALVSGCCDRCGVGTQATLSGAAVVSGEYQADGIRASIQQKRRGSPDAPYLVSLSGPVWRISQEGPLAALSTRLRVDQLLDAEGRVLRVGPHQADGETGSEPWIPYFHFSGRPPLALQGRGTFGPLSEDIFDAKRVRGIAEVWEMSRLECLKIDLRSTELPMAFVKVAEGAWVAVRGFEQRGKRVELDVWSFVSNVGGQEPRMDPRPKPLNDYVVGGGSGTIGYDEAQPPFLFGFELLDEYGCVLDRQEPHGDGLFTMEGLYKEMDTTLEIDVDRKVVAINVIVATEVQVIAIPFESELRIWLRNDKGVIRNTDPRTD